MPQLTSNQANTLFGSSPGQLGLSILRVRIDPGGSGNWGTELGNAQEAQALGAIIIASPWSPPASMTSNGSTIGGSLNTSSYASYAYYLQSFVNYMAGGGVNLYAISMQNEPDANVTYESCTWTGAQMDTWVANEGSILSTKLMMPESESFITSYSDPTLNDSAAVGYVSIVAGHIYGTKPTYYTNAINKGKDVWMTEHYLSPSGAQPTIADALTAAKEISDSMEVADYNAYLWWWLRDWNAGGGVTNTGLLDANDNPTYYGLALGQFSNFVRPGYVRASATYNPGSGNVYVTAYEGTHSVIVAINMGTTAVSQQFVLKNQTISTMTPYQTSATESIAQLNGVTLTGNSFIYSLPAQSITTFVH
jgi:glucuronoarabinoxylan endo-1,4-beta-xylanase